MKIHLVNNCRGAHARPFQLFMNLFQHQKNLIARNPAKHLLAWACGTGKTAAAICLAENNANSILVVCPKSVVLKWKQEIKTWRIKYNQDWTGGSPCVFKVLSKETFRRDAGDLPKYEAVIFDEMHNFSGLTSQMHQAAYNYIQKHDVKYIYGLTATPFLSTPWNIYALARLLGRKLNYAKFKEKYFTTVKMGHRMIPVAKTYINGIPVKDEVAKMVNALGNTIKMSDCIDLPESVYQEEYFGLTANQKKAVKEINKSETIAITKWGKVHQICGGCLKQESGKPIYYKSEKLPRLLEIINEHKKIAVICRYVAEIEMITKSIEKINKKYLVLNGATKNREDVIKQANEANDMIILLTCATSEGFELPTFSFVVFYSYDFSLKNYIQICGRFRRINAPQKVVYLSLIVQKTVDEDVYENVVIRKCDFQVAIYNGKKMDMPRESDHKHPGTVKW